MLPPPSTDMLAVAGKGWAACWARFEECPDADCLITCPPPTILWRPSVWLPAKRCTATSTPADAFKQAALSAWHHMQEGYSDLGWPPHGVIFLSFLLSFRRATLTTRHLTQGTLQLAMDAPAVQPEPAAFVPPPLRPRAVGWYPEWGKVGAASCALVGAAVALSVRFGTQWGQWTVWCKRTSMVARPRDTSLARRRDTSLARLLTSQPAILHQLSWGCWSTDVGLQPKLQPRLCQHRPQPNSFALCYQVWEKYGISRYSW